MSRESDLKKIIAEGRRILARPNTIIEGYTEEMSNWMHEFNKRTVALIVEDSEAELAEIDKTANE